MRTLVILLVLGSIPAWGQSNLEFANLREDVRLLSQRVGELLLRVEQLERENGELRQQAEGASRGFVTVAQMNEMLADINRSVKGMVSAAEAESRELINRRIEQLAQQTDQAIAAVNRAQAGARASSSPRTVDATTKGISYTVQKGDTLSLIARKTGSRLQDILAANNLSETSTIIPGQVLFVPGGK
ncbi:MAG: LysM peptidoglycan-binding domain-containing protein [Opitutaceae bacterium]|nr:LysM peptidoglycan-binding domain-containing protein [Opitutaceae bacterium]